MRCIHLNIRGASFLVLAVLLNGVKHTQMGKIFQFRTEIFFIKLI